MFDRYLEAAAAAAVFLGALMVVAEPASAEDPSALPAAESQHTVVVDGVERSYRLDLPPGYSPDEPVPLVVGLHGAGRSTADTFAESTGVAEAVADRGWIAVYPSATQDAEGFSAWNAGICCSPATDHGVDDVAFVDALLDRVIAGRAVDPRRVYVVGQSNGAAMAYRVGCELAGRIAAIAVVGGVIDPAAACAPVRPVSLLIVHGRQDRHMPFDGGSDLIEGDWPSVAQATHRWRPLGGCRGPLRRTSSVSVATDRWGPCAPGVEVRLDAIIGWNHRWPGGPHYVPRADGYEATGTILSFFASRRLRSAYPPHDFGDVAERAWYAYAVDWVDSTEVLQGFAGNEFRPGAPIRRAAAERAVDRLLGRSTDDTGGGRRPLAREEAARLLAEAAGRLGQIPPVRWARTTGVIPVRSDGEFHGGWVMPRLDFAASLYALAATPSAWSGGRVRGPFAV